MSARSDILKEAKQLAKEVNDTEMIKYLRQFKPTPIGFPLSCSMKVYSWIYKIRKENENRFN